MAMKKVPIESASATQLAEFAENVLGLDGVNYRLGVDKIVSMMRVASYDKDFIEIGAPEADITRIEPPANQNGRRMATIRIYTSEKPGGSEPVQVAVNGRRMDIPRDRDCTIPWEYYHVLSNAKKLIYRTDDNGILLPGKPDEVHEYPFSLIHEDPPVTEAKAA